MELHKEAVRRQITLDADRAATWEALADPRRLEGWFARSVDVDIVEGGRGTVTDHDGTVREVTVEEVLPGRRLALRWRAGDEAESIVELTLDDTGTPGRTRLVVVEVPVAVVRAIGVQVSSSPAFRSGPALVAA